MTGRGMTELKRQIENDNRNDNAGGKNGKNDDRSDTKAKIGNGNDRNAGNDNGNDRNAGNDNGNDRNVVTRGNVGREIIQIGIKDIQANGPMLMNSPTAIERTLPVNNVGSLSSL